MDAVKFDSAFHRTTSLTRFLVKESRPATRLLGKEIRPATRFYAKERRTATYRAAEHVARGEGEAAEAERQHLRAMKGEALL